MNLTDLKEKFESFNYVKKLEFIKNYNIDGFFLSASNSDEIIFETLCNTSKDLYYKYKHQEEEKKQNGKEYKYLISICPNNEIEFVQFMSWFLDNRKVDIKFFSDLKEEFITALNLSHIKDLYLEEKFKEYKSLVIDKDWAFENINGVKTVLQTGNTRIEYKYYSLGSEEYLKGYSDFYMIFSKTYFEELFSNGNNSTISCYKQKLEYCIKGQNDSKFFVFLKEEKEYFDKNRNFKCLEVEYSNDFTQEQIKYGKDLYTDIKLIDNHGAVPITVLFLYYCNSLKKIRPKGEVEWKEYFTKIGLTPSTAWVKYLSKMKGNNQKHLEMRVKYFQKLKESEAKNFLIKYEQLVKYAEIDLLEYKNLYIA